MWWYKMKKKFNTLWKASKQPRKQRKYKANAPLHIKRKFLAANLSKELRKKYERRSFIVRKGDLVKIMRGKFKGKKGKINQVFTKKGVVAIEKIQRQKKDGTKINVFFNPSNLQIQELILEDKKRTAALKKERRKKEKKETKEPKLKQENKLKEKTNGTHKKTDNN